MNGTGALPRRGHWIGAEGIIRESISGDLAVMGRGKPMTT
jgi:hypothetical protein